MSADNNITLSAVLKNAEKEGFLSNRAASVLLSQGDRQIQMPQMKPAFEDPIYVAIIIDNSGSMDPYKAAVIRGQNQLLSVLRGSKKCKKKALLVGHYLFSGTVQPLNSFELLDPSGNDRVTVLDDSSYTIADSTALYQAVFHVLQEMVGSIHATQNQGIAAKFIIALFTDGEDTDGGVDPADIRNTISELRNKKFLSQSVVVGLTGGPTGSNALTEASVMRIRDTLGFDQAISVDKAPAEIRRAFDLLSESILQRL